MGSQRHPLPASPSTANEGRNDYHPMFFTHDRAFEELFGICIQLLNKTWKEMRATAEDFNKVRVAELRGLGKAAPGQPGAAGPSLAIPELEDGMVGSTESQDRGTESVSAPGTLSRGLPAGLLFRPVDQYQPFPPSFGDRREAGGDSMGYRAHRLRRHRDGVRVRVTSVTSHQGYLVVGATPRCFLSTYLSDGTARPSKADHLGVGSFEAAHRTVKTL